ncbi:hypothetical protein [Gottschalkia acidurici]|nr:hypothetical protein [Gottschalkia acidurici]
MLVYKSNLVMLGINSPGMYHKNTILHLMLQRIITEEELTKRT